MRVNSWKMEQRCRHLNVKTMEPASMVRAQIYQEASAASVHEGSLDHSANIVRLLIHLIHRFIVHL